MDEYVEQMALLLDLQLRDEYRDGVVGSFEKIKAIAFWLECLLHPILKNSLFAHLKFE
ncbi:MAG: DUF4089 domain-containing protein [Nostoc sp.]|uniref:DUF4089 domain-containing protein n=1 Tax=Nostoc sp. TaxID=1180 RepID=UPI002FF486D2